MNTNSRKKSAIVRSILMISTVAIASSGAHADDKDAGAQIYLSTGVDYSTGDYGFSENTELVFAPISVGIRSGNLSLRASTGYVSLSGPGDIVSLDGGPDIINRGGVSTNNSGWSDLSLGASYTIISNNPDAPYLTLSAGVKLPTANEAEGLGAGSTDLNIGAELSKPIGAGAIFVSAGYKFSGQSDIIVLEDVFSAGVGAQFPLTASWDVIASFDYRQASISSSEESYEASIFLSGKLSPTVSIMPYLYTGFTDASPDFGTGLFLTKHF